VSSDANKQRQRHVNQLVLLKEDLADIEADLQGAIADSERLSLQKEVERILRDIEDLELQLSSAATT
jgi:hypothetical protein